MWARRLFADLKSSPKTLGLLQLWGEAGSSRCKGPVAGEAWGCPRNSKPSSGSSQEREEKGEGGKLQQLSHHRDGSCLSSEIGGHWRQQWDLNHQLDSLGYPLCLPTDVELSLPNYSLSEVQVTSGAWAVGRTAQPHILPCVLSSTSGLGTARDTHSLRLASRALRLSLNLHPPCSDQMTNIN